MTERIIQRNNKDCGIASTAMFLDISYEKAASILPNVTKTKGLYYSEIVDAIQEYQGTKIEVWETRDCKPLPAVPAILEVAMQINRIGGHFVYCLNDGTVLDPAPNQPCPWRIEGYMVIRAMH